MESSIFLWGYSSVPNCCNLRLQLLTESYLSIFFHRDVLQVSFVHWRRNNPSHFHRQKYKFTLGAAITVWLFSSYSLSSPWLCDSMTHLLLVESRLIIDPNVPVSRCELPLVEAVVSHNGQLRRWGGGGEHLQALTFMWWRVALPTKGDNELNTNRQRVMWCSTLKETKTNWFHTWYQFLTTSYLSCVVVKNRQHSISVWNVTLSSFYINRD